MNLQQIDFWQRFNSTGSLNKIKSHPYRFLHSNEKQKLQHSIYHAKFKNYSGTK